LGGEKQVKSADNFHYRGEIELGNHVLSIEEYIQKPLNSLKTISDKSIVLTKDGNNGRILWSEKNGSVSSINYFNIPEHEVQKSWAEYAYTDPKNTLFTSTDARKVSIDGTTYYEIKIRNNMTDEVVTQHYDAKTFLLKRELREFSDNRVQTEYSDYRYVDNIMIAFQIDTTDLTTDIRQSIIWNTVEIGVYIPDSRFEAPDENMQKNNSSLLREIGARLNTYA